MLNDEGAGYFRFSMPPADWMRLRARGFAELSDRGQMAVVDSLQADFDRGAVDAQDLMPWFPELVESPVRQLAIAPMSPLRFMMYEVDLPELRDDVASYARRLYRKRYDQLGWRAKKGESSDTQLLREAVIRFMVMDVRDPAARRRAARLGRMYIGYRAKENRGAVDSQLAVLVLAAAVQESGEGLFDHLVGLLGSTSDAATRNRILLALGHAEDPTLCERALDLALDPRVRLSEIQHLLGTQFANPRTRERAWSWLTERFDALAARFGSSEVGGSPWYAASFCTDGAAREVQRFFEPRVTELTGGPRNLASVVEAISLCAKKAEVHRAGVARAFVVR
jgi:alanyl aminopeptidase